MSNQNRNRLTDDELRYLIGNEIAEKETAPAQERPSCKSYERTGHTDTPARPDAIDIARKFAVIIAGSLLGAIAIVIVFALLR